VIEMGKDGNVNQSSLTASDQQENLDVVPPHNNVQPSDLALL